MGMQHSSFMTVSHMIYNQSLQTILVLHLNVTHNPAASYHSHLPYMLKIWCVAHLLGLIRESSTNLSVTKIHMNMLLSVSSVD